MSTIRWHVSASTVIAFSLMTSTPSSIARQMYWWWVPHGVVTMTNAGFVSFTIRSKSAAA